MNNKKSEWVFEVRITLFMFPRVSLFLDSSDSKIKKKLEFFSVCWFSILIQFSLEVNEVHFDIHSTADVSWIMYVKCF